MIAGLSIKRVWKPQVDANLMHVADTDAASYRSHSSHAILQSDKSEKRKKYGTACLACWACFTPLCFSVDGVMGKEADYFLQLAIKWGKSYSSVMGWIRASLSFAIL